MLNIIIVPNVRVTAVRTASSFRRHAEVNLHCEELMLREKKSSRARLTSWDLTMALSAKFVVCPKMTVCLKEVVPVVDFQT